jgi:hypothetical protein
LLEKVHPEESREQRAYRKSAELAIAYGANRSQFKGYTSIYDYSVKVNVFNKRTELAPEMYKVLYAKN